MMLLRQKIIFALAADWDVPMIRKAFSEQANPEYYHTPYFSAFPTKAACQLAVTNSSEISASGAQYSLCPSDKCATQGACTLDKPDFVPDWNTGSMFTQNEAIADALSN